MIDRAGLAALRRRREALQPEDVGVPRGARCWTSGLRREEVAARCDTVHRLLLTPRAGARAAALLADDRLDRAGTAPLLEERDHLFRLAGHHRRCGARPASTSARACCASSTASPTPRPRSSPSSARRCAEPLGVALVGDATAYTRPRAQPRLPGFTDPASRALYAPGEHTFLSRMYASGLRGLVTLRGPGSRAATSPISSLGGERGVPRRCGRPSVGLRPHDVKRFVHPEVGALELQLPDAARPRAVAPAVRLHRGPGQRELREAAAAVRPRAPERHSGSAPARGVMSTCRRKRSR